MTQQELLHKIDDLSILALDVRIKFMSYHGDDDILRDKIKDDLKTLDAELDDLFVNIGKSIITQN